MGCRHHQVALSIATSVLLSLVAGCAQPKQKTLYEQMLAPQYTAAELKARVRELSLQSVGIVEQTGTRIYAETDDTDVRAGTLIWMIRFNEETVRSTFYADPAASGIDMIVLVLQMRDWLESGDGSILFGAYQDEAVAAGRRIAELWEQARRDAAGGIVREETTVAIETWVEQNPIEGRGFNRTSIAPLLAALSPDPDRSLFAATATVAGGMDQIADRIETLQTQLPKQMIWGAALLAEAMITRAEVEELIVHLDRAVTLAEDLPEIVNEQRRETLQVIHDERVDTLERIDAQRIDTFERVEQMRAESHADVSRQREETLDRMDATLEAVLTQVDGQRDDTLARVDASLAATVESIDRQRRETLEQVDAMVAGALADTSDGASLVVDRAFWRLLVLVGALVLGGVILLVVARLLSAGRASRAAA